MCACASTIRRVARRIQGSGRSAVYVIMYYLGSLVIYFPSYLENLYDSKHAWIIERFVTCADIIFLRNMANNILRHHYIYSSTV